MQHNYSYESALTASSRINWKVEDIIGGQKKLDFTKPFLPESLAQVNNLAFLTPAEKTTLNQIRGHEYLSMFGLVEEFILPYVVDHARPQLSGDDYRARALLGFAGEEAKHIHLFKRFREEFEEGFCLFLAREHLRENFFGGLDESTDSHDTVTCVRATCIIVFDIALSRILGGVQYYTMPHQVFHVAAQQSR